MACMDLPERQKANCTYLAVVNQSTNQLICRLMNSWYLVENFWIDSQLQQAKVILSFATTWTKRRCCSNFLFLLIVIFDTEEVLLRSIWWSLFFRDRFHSFYCRVFSIYISVHSSFCPAMDDSMKWKTYTPELSPRLEAYLASRQVEKILEACMAKRLRVQFRGSTVPVWINDPEILLVNDESSQQNMGYLIQIINDVDSAPQNEGLWRTLTQLDRVVFPIFQSFDWLIDCLQIYRSCLEWILLIQHAIRFQSNNQAYH